MKKVIIFIILLLFFGVGGVYGYRYIIKNTDTLTTFNHAQPSKGNYIIKKSGKIVDKIDDREEAIKKADEIRRSIVIDTQNNEWIYSNLSPFLIITDTAVHDFEIFDSAMRYAQKNGYSKIYYNNDENPIWEDGATLPKQVKLDVMHFLQYPELPRGCEVTSLAMLFSYYGKDISKMELAEQVKKDTTPYKVDADGRITYGNPYDGFVGDMYNAKNNGYGVYHTPIADLTNQYFEDRALDLTGVEFEDVLYFISNDYPMWVIINGSYKPLDESYFNIWHTPTGIVKVTQRVHSVLITGYDEKNIYINDPLYNGPNRVVDREMFKKAWEQMGNQAVTILK